jgi:hypothetical protein
MTKTKEDTTFHELADGMFASNGFELLKTALDDWLAFSDGDPFSSWFPEAEWIKPKAVYVYSAGLDGIKEVEDDEG